MGLSELSDILWRERRLLELLVFKLEEEQLLLGAGRTRWLTLAGQEIETVRDEIRRVELLRATAVDALAPGLGLEPGTSLRALGEVVDQPWREILQAHRSALLASTREIEALADTNRDLLSEGCAATGRELSWLGR
jgi:hypothetical protein